MSTDPFPNADDLGFELLPDDDDGLSPADELNAAIAGALAAPEDPPAAQGSQPVPFGSTAFFDFEAGRFLRRGGRPVYVSGLDALQQRCMMALCAARFAHPVLPDTFGQEGLTNVLGRLDDEVADDVKQIIREALLAVDRVVDVTLTPSFDRLAGVVRIPDLEVVTDEEVTLSFEDLTLKLGPR